MMSGVCFLGTALSASGPLADANGRRRRGRAAAQTLEPLVWPVITRQTGIRNSSLADTNTVLDIVGRIGPPPSLVIFSEGNHLMALLSEEIVGGFPSWAKAQPQYADLNVDNIVVATLPQPIVVQMVSFRRNRAWESHA